MLRDDRGEDVEHLTQNWAPGTVVPFVGSPDSLPDNWVPCAGQKLPKSEYGDLLSILGESYSRSPDDADFSLPDYRGMFVVDRLDHSGGWRIHYQLLMGRADATVLDHRWKGDLLRDPSFETTSKPVLWAMKVR